MRFIVVAVVCVSLFACPPPSLADAGSEARDGSVPLVDAGHVDAGELMDAGVVVDAGRDDAGVSTCPAGWLCPSTPLFSATIGAWYALPFQAETGAPRCGTPGGWAESRFKPVRGYYDSAAPETVAGHFDELADAGVDFLVLDFTNGIAPDPNQSHPYATGETILQHNANPASKTKLPIALAIGAQLWAYRSLPGQKNEADFVLSHYATQNGVDNPYYLRVDGKPLLVSYNGHDLPNAFATNWTDARFHVGRANPMASPAIPALVSLGSAWWGWVAEWPSFVSPEVVTVSPGADNTHRCDCIGTIHYDRNGGTSTACAECDVSCTFDPRGCAAFATKCAPGKMGGGVGATGTQPGLLFTLEWLRAVKAKPRYVVISSFNHFDDETAIEPAVARTDRVGPGGQGEPWRDYYGDETPDFYLQIATAYAHLRTGLQPDTYYQDEDSHIVYLQRAGTLVPQPALPHRKPIILLPAGTLVALGAPKTAPAQLPSEGTVVVAPNRPHAVFSRGAAVRFEVAAVASRFGAPVSMSEADYDALPYGGTVRAKAPVYVAPGLPPAFESDRGELWEFDCLDVVTLNGSFVSSVQQTPFFTSFTVRSGLHCR